MKKLCKACKILMVFVMCFGAILLANNVFAAKNFGPTPIILHECEAGSWQNYNEGYHVKKCTVTGCGEIMETASHNNKLTWTGTTHTKTCNDCGGKYTRNHTYNKETGKCTGCPYVCVHSNCEIKYNSNNHWEECRICGFKRSDAKHSIRDGECTKPGCGYKCEHEYEAGVCTECGYECKSHRYNSQGVCSICEYKDPAICNHYVWEWKTTNTMHIKVCKEGCNKELSTGTHTYSKETGKCTACNYSCKHSSYTWRWTGDTHTKICAACDYTISTENHIYGETLGDCEMCPYVCEHDWEIIGGRGNDYTHQQTEQCSICKASRDLEEEPHIFNKDGECEVCEYKCEHKYKKVYNCYNYPGPEADRLHNVINTCDYCGMTITEVEEHIFKEEGNYLICEMCGYKINIGTPSSRYQETEQCRAGDHAWKVVGGSVGDYIHQQMEECILCGKSRYLEEEPHTFNEEGVCEVCGHKCEHKYTKVYGFSSSPYEADRLHNVIKTCDYCDMTITEVEEHIFKEEGNYLTCKECMYQIWIGNDENESTADTIYQETEQCRAGEHDWEVVGGSGNDYVHKQMEQCRVCGESRYLEQEPHSFDEAGVCKVCYHKCEHNWEVVIEAVDYYTHQLEKQCNLCGIRMFSAGTHMCNNNGICTVCKYEPDRCEHVYIKSYKYYTSMSHKVENKCTICGEVESISQENHKLDNNNCCYLCWGVTGCTDGYPHDSSYTYTRFNDQVHKTKIKCLKCGEESMYENYHEFNDNGMCGKCFYRRECSNGHNYEEEYTQHVSEFEHEYVKWCVDCGDRQSYLGAHNYQITSRYESEDTHSTVELCTECGYNVTRKENHNFNFYNICTDCGYALCDHELEYRYIDVDSPLHHDKDSICTKCSTIFIREVEPHRYGDNKVCIDCGYATYEGECMEGQDHEYKVAYMQLTDVVHLVFDKCVNCNETNFNYNEEHSFTDNKCRCGYEQREYL